MRQLDVCNEANDDKNVFVRKIKIEKLTSPKIFIIIHVPLICFEIHFSNSPQQITHDFPKI